MASADSPGSPLGFQTPPPLPRWPLEAMMASRHLQSPESGSQQRSRAGFRTRQYPNGLWSRARPPRPPRTQGGVWRPSGVVQGFKTPQRTPAWCLETDISRARLPCATRHPDVLQKATRSSNTAKPPILYTYDLWRPVRRLNGLPDNFAHPTGPLKTARHRQTKPDKTLSSI